MKSWVKVIAYISIVPLLTVLYFIDNIRGYYRFKELCQQEKPLVINSKLEKDVGWQIDLKKMVTSDYAAQIAGLPHIKFVRFRNWKDHELYDVYYVGTTPRVADGGRTLSRMNRQEVFNVQPANLENQVIYQWGDFNETLSAEVRMSRGGYRFTDLRTNKIVLSFTELGYSTFDRGRTLFDAPSGNLCGNAGKIWEQEIQSQIF